MEWSRSLMEVINMSSTSGAALKRNCTKTQTPAAATLQAFEIVEDFHRPLLHDPVTTLLVSLLVIVYLFFLLARICDRYFVTCVKIIAFRLHLGSEVAGAIVMAGAMSSPDLFVNSVSTFLTGGDLGLGTVLGCALINMLLLPALCLFLSPPKAIKLDWWSASRECLVYGISVFLLTCSLYDGLISWEEAFLMVLLYVFYLVVLSQDRPLRAGVESVCQKIRKSKSDSSWPLLPPKPESQMSYGVEEQLLLMDELSDNGWESWSTQSWRGRILSVLAWPGELLLKATVPDPRSRPSLYPLTFIVCVLWIGLTSYAITWLITLAGSTLGVSDSLMGVTLIALGMSIPEIVSSVIVSRQGHGSMALSNALGSNSFDILVALGLPWFLQALTSGRPIVVLSPGLGYSSLMLASSLVLLYVSIASHSFSITKQVAALCLILYSCIAVVSTLLETDLLFSSTPECST